MSGSFGLSTVAIIPPPSQKADERPIGFILEIDGRPSTEVTLGIRPEDFSRTDPSRVTVHHTLGGAWADNFGPGLANISISGITGWRGGLDGDGEARWRKLRDDVFKAWHRKRRENVEAGRDPARVKLLYVDALNDFVAEVAPMSLTLRRSRSRPLLIQYSMAMVVLDENADQLRYLRGGASIAALGAVGGFFESVLGSLRTIREAIGSANRWVQANLVQPVRQFLGLANSVLVEVVGITRDVRGLSASVLSIPTMIAQTGMNAFRTYAAVVNLPAQIKADAMRVASAFSNVLCFLLRSRPTRRTYTDYASLYGASNCSSISGGRPSSPLAGTNPFTAIPRPAGVPGLSVSTAAQTSMRAVAQSDPALRPLPLPQIGSHLATINAGVSFTPTAAAA